MADELEAELRLLFENAVAEVESALEEAYGRAAELFGTETADALTSAIEGVTATPVDVPVTADTAEAFANIDDFAAVAEALDPQVDVTADASNAESVLEDFAALADATDFEATMGLDTSEAEASLESFSSNAEDAAASAGNLDAGVAGFSATAGLATGNTAGLAVAAETLGDGMGTAGKVITAGAGAVGVFFHEALDAQAVTMRFHRTLGDLATTVDTIDIGNLNTDISELAVQLGSSDEQMRRAATNSFLFATNSGIARNESAKFSEQLLALSARAVALNPDLGDVGDAANNLQRALITGRERALVPYNLGLNKTEVAARATELALAAGRTEVTGIDKAMAGAQLATEKFGGHLQQDIAQGAENPTIKLRSLKTQLKEFIEQLGTPLIAPVFDTLKQGLPTAEAAGTIISDLAQGVLPVFVAGLEAVNGILQPLVALLDVVPAPVIASAAAFFLLGNRLGPTATKGQEMFVVFSAILPLLSSISPEAASAAIQIGGMAFAATKMGLSPGWGIAAGAAQVLGQHIGGAEGKAISLAGTGLLIGAGIAGPVGAAVGAVAGLALGFLSGGESAAEMAKRVAGLADEIAKLGDGGALKAFLESSKQDQTIGDDMEYVREQLRALAAESPEAARKVIDGMEGMVGAVDPLTGQVLLTREQFHQLHEEIDKGAASFTKHDRATREAAAAEKLLIDTTPTASEAILQQQQALDAFVSSALGQLPTLRSVLSGTQGDLKAFGLSLTSSVSPQAFLDNLNATIFGIVSFQANLEQVVSGGFTNVALFVSQQGPEIGGAYLQAFLAAPPAVQEATNEALATFQTSTTNLDAYLRGPFAGIVAGGYQTGISGVEAVARDVFGGSVPATIDAATPAAAAAGGRHGKATGDALSGAYKATAPPGVAQGTHLAGQVLSGAAQYVAQFIAYGAGKDIGTALMNGIRWSILTQRGPLESLMRETIRGLADAAANAGSPSEHLFYDAGHAQMSALGRGYSDAGAAVVAEAESIVRAAAAGVDATGIPLPYAAAPGAGAGAGGVTIGQLTIALPVGVTEETAGPIGRAAAKGFVDGLADRDIVVAVRTN